MLRFLSRRRGRSVGGQTSSQIKNQRLLSNKNIVQCRVVLLDGTDLPIELSVRHLFTIIVVKKLKKYCLVGCEVVLLFVFTTIHYRTITHYSLYSYECIVV